MAENYSGFLHDPIFVQDGTGEIRFSDSDATHTTSIGIASWYANSPESHTTCWRTKPSFLSTFVNVYATKPSLAAIKVNEVITVHAYLILYTVSIVLGTSVSVFNAADLPSIAG